MPDYAAGLAELEAKQKGFDAKLAKLETLFSESNAIIAGFREVADARAAIAIERLERIFGIASNIEDGIEGLDSAAEIKRLADEALNALGKPAD